MSMQRLKRPSARLLLIPLPVHRTAMATGTATGTETGTGCAGTGDGTGTAPRALAGTPIMSRDDRPGRGNQWASDGPAAGSTG